MSPEAFEREQKVIDVYPSNEERQYWHMPERSCYEQACLHISFIIDWNDFTGIGLNPTFFVL